LRLWLFGIPIMGPVVAYIAYRVKRPELIRLEAEGRAQGSPSIDYYLVVGVFWPYCLFWFTGVLLYRNHQQKV
jgi:hypothetical protein